jgi:hypothetical protein
MGLNFYSDLIWLGGTQPTMAQSKIKTSSSKIWWAMPALRNPESKLQNWQMEFLTVFLAGLMGVVLPAGLIADNLAADAIRDQLADSEGLLVRIDNTPSYQILQGRIDRVRIAGRGVMPLEDVRIAVLELETEAIALNPSAIRQGNVELEQPFQGGVRLVLTEADINQALQSDVILERLRDLSFSLALPDQPGQVEDYRFSNPQIDFLGADRLRFQVSLQARSSSESVPEDQASPAQMVEIVLESGLSLVDSDQFAIVDPVLTVDGSPIPAELIDPFVEGINRQLNLRHLEDDGLMVRFLQWDISEAELAIAIFLRLEPEFISSRLISSSH